MYTFLFLKIGHKAILCLGPYCGILMIDNTYLDMYNVLGSLKKVLVLWYLSLTTAL